MSNKYFNLRIFLTASVVFLSVISEAVALEKPDLSIKGSFRISQESFKSNGVLVSRPKAEDVKVLNLIQLNQIKSLEDYTLWVNQNVTYQKDGLKDIWLSASETLRVKKADCEDYAFLNTAVLRVLGYNPKFAALVKKGRQSHAICLFKKDGYYFLFDNAKLIQTDARSMQEFAEFVTTNLNYSHLLELDPKTKQWQLIYKDT